MRRANNKSPHPITSIHFTNNIPLLRLIDRRRGKMSRSEFIVGKLKRALR